jgi:hypothetical protein
MPASAAMSRRRQAVSVLMLSPKSIVPIHRHDTWVSVDPSCRCDRARRTRAWDRHGKTWVLKREDRRPDQASERCPKDGSMQSFLSPLQFRHFKEGNLGVSREIWGNRLSFCCAPYRMHSFLKVVFPKFMPAAPRILEFTPVHVDLRSR